MRESFFSAVRSCIEAMARRNPLVLAFEDIHWADHGMLDLIEYLAQWVRGPLLLLCLARDELLDRRAGWGGGRREATSILLDPLTVDETRELVTSLLPGGSRRSRRGLASSPSGRAATRSSPRRWCGASPRRAARRRPQLPDTVQALLAARLDSLEPVERRLVQHAAVVGRTFWEGSLSQIVAEASSDSEELWRAR